MTCSYVIGMVAYYAYQFEEPCRLRPHSLSLAFNVR